MVIIFSIQKEKKERKRKSGCSQHHFSISEDEVVRAVKEYFLSILRNGWLNSPVNEDSKMANRKQNRVALKFGRIVEGNILNNILKVPNNRR